MGWQEEDIDGFFHYHQCVGSQRRAGCLFVAPVEGAEVLNYTEALLAQQCVCDGYKHLRSLG